VKRAHLTGNDLVPRTAAQKVVMMAHLTGNYWAPLKALKKVAMMAEKRDFR